MKKEKMKYSIIVFEDSKDAETIKYVTSLGEGNYAHWDAGMDAKLFDSRQFAEEVAYGLSVNGYPAAVIEVPSYLKLFNKLTVPSDKEDEGPVTLDEITGHIGSWLDRDMSDIPLVARGHLSDAYRLCSKSLSKEDA